MGNGKEATKAGRLADDALCVPSYVTERNVCSYRLFVSALS